MNNRTPVIITVLVIILITGVLAYIFIDTTRDKEITFDDSLMNISGMFGTKIKRKEIQSVTLVDQIPKIQFKINGASIGRISIGLFKLEGVEKTHLTLMNNRKAPYIYILTKSQRYYINYEDMRKTENMYDLIQRWYLGETVWNE
jgi:hypothetical protein